MFSQIDKNIDSIQTIKSVENDTENKDEPSSSHLSRRIDHIKDLRIDTRDEKDDDISQSGLTSGLASPPNNALSICSTNEKGGVNPFNFELLSTPLLLEKEASLRQTTIINNMEGTDFETNEDSQNDISQGPRNNLNGLLSGDGQDEDQVLNVNINVNLTREHEDLEDNDGENSPFSRKSELLNHKEKMMRKHEIQDGVRTEIDIDNNDIDTLENSVEKTGKDTPKRDTIV